MRPNHRFTVPLLLQNAMSWKVLLLGLFCLAACCAASAIPHTKTRFRAGYEYRVTVGNTSVGPTLKRTIGAIGGLGSEAAKYLTESSLPAGSAVSISGDVLVDTTNNIMYYRVSRWQLTGPQPVVNMSRSIVSSSMINYDIAKNYTWDLSTCSCTGIRGSSQMPLFTLPSFSTLVDNATSLDQGNGQSADKISLFSAPFTFDSFVNPINEGVVSQIVSTVVQMYVDSSNFTRRVEFDVLLNSAGPAQNISIMFDLWDPTEVADNVLLVPDDTCKNACAAEMRVADAPTACADPAPQCACIPQDKLAFCNGTNNAISSLIYVEEADATAKAAAAATIAALNSVQNGAALSAACEDQIKQFMCAFYLPPCTGSHAYWRPNMTTSLTCFANSGFLPAQLSAAYKASGAFSSYRTIAGDTTHYPNGTGLQGWQIGIIVLGSAALAGAVGFAVFRNFRSQKPEYESV